MKSTCNNQTEYIIIFHFRLAESIKSKLLFESIALSVVKTDLICTRIMKYKGMKNKGQYSLRPE